MRKYIIIGLLLSGITGLIGIILYPTFWVYLVNTRPMHTSETGLEITPEAKYTSEVLESEKQKQRESTFFNRAQKEENIMLCDSIEDPAFATECRDQFTVRKAVSTSNPATCNILTGSLVIQKCEDEVFYTLSLSAADKNLCGRIADATRKNTCMEEVSLILYRTMTSSGELTETSCDTLEGSAYEACVREFQKQKDGSIYELATKTQDIALCKNIADDEIRSLCQDTIRLKLALSDNNNTLCTSITDQKKQSLCEKQLSKTTMISLYKTVVSSHDINLCVKITDEKLARQCHDTILLEKIRSDKNTTLCNNLFATGSILACKSMITTQVPTTSTGDVFETTPPQ